VDRPPNCKNQTVFGAFGAVTAALSNPRTRQGAFGAFGVVNLPRTSHHKQLPCLTLMGLPSGLERTRGVVEHYRAPVQEEQSQRTAAVGGPQGGCR
jgi:hypothetical protein